MRKILVILAVGVFFAMVASPVYAVEGFMGPTELVQYNPAKAYNGYTLFRALQAGTQYPFWLIDMEGNVVHTWDIADGSHNEELLENGNMLAGLAPPEAREANPDRMVSPGGSNGRIVEVDWDSNEVWRFDYFSNDYRHHHDQLRIFNEKLNAYTTLVLSTERRTMAEALALGTDPDNYEQEAGDGDWSPDDILEVDMDGNIIWHWRFFDHTVQDLDPNLANFGIIAETPERLDVNWINPPRGPGLQRDWNHTNSLDYNEDLGLVAVNAKHQNEFYVVDHQGTFVAGDPAQTIANAAGPGGDFLYRFGCPNVYDQGEIPGWNDNGDAQMFGSHDIQWIRPAAWTGGPELPGAGNFLIFDNSVWNCESHQSHILEINPYLDADGNDTGSYVNPPDAGYSQGRSNQVVWEFSSNNASSFYARHISSCMRLPNGNTLIDAGSEGHMFEVTADGEVVWEYFNPISRGGVSTFKTDNTSGPSVFRAHRYGPDHPALVGRDLTPMGPITNWFFEPAMQKFQGSTN